MFNSISTTIITMTACFKYIIKSYDIAFYICIGISYTIAHTCLCCKIHNHLRLVLSKYSINQRFICYITFYKNKSVGIFLKLIKTP